MIPKFVGAPEAIIFYQPHVSALWLHLLPNLAMENVVHLFDWQPNSLSFFLNVPIVCSQALSMTMERVIAYFAANKESPSWASDLLWVGKTLTQQTLLQNLCILVLHVQGNNRCFKHVSKTSWDSLLYFNWQSFVLNLLCRVLCRTVVTPCFVVAFTVLFAASREIFHLCANCTWSTLPPISAVCKEQILMSFTKWQWNKS